MTLVICAENDDNEWIEQFKKATKNTSDDIIDDAVISNENVERYFSYVIEFLRTIEQKCSNIILTEIRKDNSFEFNISIKEELQSDLFITILSGKDLNENISEISINTKSLESILIK